MNEGLISRRYARALLKYALDRGSAEKIYSEAANFEKSYVSYPALQKALLNPVLPKAEKEKLIAAASGSASGSDFLRFVNLVLQNHREAYMRSICLMYQKLYREYEHIVQVKIITARPLSDEVTGRIRHLIEEKIEGKTEFVMENDPSIIGGFVLQCDSMQLDASVKNKLKTLRLNLLNSKQI